MDSSQLYIGGEWVASESGIKKPVIDPATGAQFTTAALGNAADAEKAIAAAKRAYDREWSDWSAHDRSRLLNELASVLKGAFDELVELETRENGKPLAESERDVQAAIDGLQFYAGAADKHYGKTLPERNELMEMTVIEPYGVVGTIIPWNWPPMHVCDFLAPALAAGNTMVLKPAPETPLSALRIAELFDDVIPDGVFNVVTGGVDAGQAITESPDVDKIAFTGNSETGAKVLESAAKNITSTMLELGGKNASIVFEDADLTDVVPGTVDSVFYNSGEACSSSERILIQKSLHDKFVERFIDATEGVVVGDGREPETDMGPLISKTQQDKVKEYIEIGLEEGATLAYAGEAPTIGDGDGGYFVAPHIFTDVARDMRIFSEEIFGPVVSITTFETEQEAIELADATEYGLTGAVWTDDPKRALRVARELDSGFVYVNTYSRGGEGAPFGGYKKSGIGRKHSFRETMQEFSQVKTLRYNLGSTVRTE